MILKKIVCKAYDLEQFHFYRKTKKCMKRKIIKINDNMVQFKLLNVIDSFYLFVYMKYAHILIT